MKLKKIALIFVSIYIFLCGLSYAIVTVGPVLACLVGIVYVACTGGNSLMIAISVFIVPLFVALIASPFVHEYLELRKKHKTDK